MNAKLHDSGRSGLAHSPRAVMECLLPCHCKFPRMRPEVGCLCVKPGRECIHPMLTSHCCEMARCDEKIPCTHAQAGFAVTCMEGEMRQQALATLAKLKVKVIKGDHEGCCGCYPLFDLVCVTPTRIQVDRMNGFLMSAIIAVLGRETAELAICGRYPLFFCLQCAGFKVICA